MTPKSKHPALASNLKEKEPESDLIASLIPPNSDLPVDPDRLKKAIKNALIKNDNKPEKIDIQSIMREQVRIYKQISEFKNSKRKAPSNSNQDNLRNAYVSSRIIKKIAEDQIHQSVKQLVSAAE